MADTNSAQLLQQVLEMAKQGTGYTLAALFGGLWLHADRQKDRLAKRIIKSALNQTKDTIRGENAVANVQRLRERKRRQLAQAKAPRPEPTDE